MKAQDPWFLKYGIQLSHDPLNGWNHLSNPESIYHLHNGVPHKEDGAACYRSHGTEIWYQHGLMHRSDGLPSMITTGGTFKFALEGMFHKADGPAISWGGSGGWKRNDKGELLFIARQEFYKFGELKKIVLVSGEIVTDPNILKEVLPDKPVSFPI